MKHIDCLQLVNFLGCLPFQLVTPHELDRILELPAEGSGIQGSVMGVGVGLWKLQGALVTVTVNCGYDCETDVGIQG